ncbi:gamma carbonic anhydrase family protein [Streptomyces sp. Li-HN-5-11]|uniref:gamma carbonic anhydrase family protein n=1 Tax=Streptomyces sp. Li-HN-5-11 TaxID=3075432 RepID=UPI0037D9B1C5
MHPDAFVHPDATVIGAVKIGAGSSVWPAAVLRGDYGRIEIGEATSIQDGTVLHTTEQWPTPVGDRCVGHWLSPARGRAGLAAVSRRRPRSPSAPGRVRAMPGAAP